MDDNFNIFACIYKRTEGLLILNPFMIEKFTASEFTVVVIGTRRLKSLMPLKVPSRKVTTLNGYEFTA